MSCRLDCFEIEVSWGLNFERRGLERWVGDGVDLVMVIKRR
jgi:hypothetical protein